MAVVVFEQSASRPTVRVTYVLPSGSATGGLEPFIVQELKAPHKVTVEQLRAWLKEIDIKAEVLDHRMSLHCMIEKVVVKIVQPSWWRL